MKKNVIGTIVVMVLFVGGYTHNCAFGAMTLLDDFNRADGSLGSPWTVQAGVFDVVGNAARGNNVALATYDGIAASALEADVQANGTSLQYVGLVLGYADNDNCLFMKVQSQNGLGTFADAAFYYGNNGGGWGQPDYFALDAPFTSARMRVELIGDVVTMTFSNIDGGAGVQTYVSASAPVTGGTGIGISGLNGHASIDNFSADIQGGPTVPVPGALLLGGLGASLVGYLRRRRAL